MVLRPGCTVGQYEEQVPKLPPDSQGQYGQKERRHCTQLIWFLLKKSWPTKPRLHTPQLVAARPWVEHIRSSATALAPPRWLFT